MRVPLPLALTFMILRAVSSAPHPNPPPPWGRVLDYRLRMPIAAMIFIKCI